MRRPAALLASALLLAACVSGRLAHERLGSYEALFEAKDYGEIARELTDEKIQNMPRRHRARAYDLLGLSLERSGDPTKALQVYQIAEGLYPKSIDVLSDLASLLLRTDLGERARPYYERVLKIHPHNAAAHHGLAVILRAQGDLPKAQTHFERCLEEWDRNPGVWKEYAEVLADRQKLPEAARAIRRSLDIRPHTDSLMLLARLERLQGRREEAYSRLAEASGREPERSDILLQKALWLLEDSRLQDSYEVSETVLLREPADSLALWIQGSIAIRRGSLAKARADLAAAAKGDDEFVADVSRAMLREITSNP